MSSEILEVQVKAADLRTLLESVRSGREVLLKEDEVAVARLVPVASVAVPRVPGLHPGAMQILGEEDEPLPDEFWTENE